MYTKWHTSISEHVVAGEDVTAPQSADVTLDVEARARREEAWRTTSARRSMPWLRRVLVKKLTRKLSRPLKGASRSTPGMACCSSSSIRTASTPPLASPLAFPLSVGAVKVCKAQSMALRENFTGMDASGDSSISLCSAFASCARKFVDSFHPSNVPAIHRSWASNSASFFGYSSHCVAVERVTGIAAFQLYQRREPKTFRFHRKRRTSSSQSVLPCNCLMMPARRPRRKVLTYS